MQIGLIIQARTGSSRLPGKVLKPLPFNSGISVLAHDIRRAKMSRLLQTIIVATTDNSEDNPIETIALLEGAIVFRGSENDVLARHYFAAKLNQLDAIVRVTSDCPCIDGKLIDKVIEEFLIDPSYDFVATVLERTFPVGLDVEVIKFEALEKAYYDAKEDYQREHVTDYIYENPYLFKLKNIVADGIFSKPQWRLTLDTEEDYLLMCAIFDHFSPNFTFKAENVITLLTEKPWLLEINKLSVQKKYNLPYEEEVEFALKLMDLYGLNKVKLVANDLLRRRGNAEAYYSESK